MIKRIWLGWTTHGDAGRYEALLKEEIFPGIEDKQVPGYRRIQLLRPDARFSGECRPSRAQIEKMHHRAHRECFIANSVRTEVVTELPA